MYPGRVPFFVGIQYRGKNHRWEAVNLPGILGTKTITAAVNRKFTPAGTLNLRVHPFRSWDDDPTMRSFSLARIVKYVNITIAILLAVALGIVYWKVWRVLPDRSGTI